MLGLAQVVDSDHGDHDKATGIVVPDLDSFGVSEDGARPEYDLNSSLLAGERAACEW